MFATQIEEAERPVRRSHAVALATAVLLGLCATGPSDGWAEPAGVTAAELVRIPEREVDLEATQRSADARVAAQREAALQRIRPEGAAPSASAASGAAAREEGIHRNQHQGVRLE